MYLHVQIVSQLPAQLKILNLRGELCKEMKIVEMSEKIDLSFLSRGEYILQISNALTRFTKRLKL